MKKNVNQFLKSQDDCAEIASFSAIDGPKPKYLQLAMIQDNENKQISTIKKLEQGNAWHFCWKCYLNQ